MRKAISLMVLVAIVAVGVLSFSTTAKAEDIKFVGVITKIEMAGASATATLKDKGGKVVPITINDELTLDKIKEHKIVEGDEIRCKYEVVGGKNVAKLFRKTAGC